MCSVCDLRIPSAQYVPCNHYPHFFLSYYPLVCISFQYRFIVIKVKQSFDKRTHFFISLDFCQAYSHALLSFRLWQVLFVLPQLRLLPVLQAYLSLRQTHCHSWVVTYYKWSINPFIYVSLNNIPPVNICLLQAGVDLEAYNDFFHSHIMTYDFQAAWSMSWNACCE